MDRSKTQPRHKNEPPYCHTETPKCQQTATKSFQPTCLTKKQLTASRPREATSPQKTKQPTIHSFQHRTNLTEPNCQPNQTAQLMSPTRCLPVFIFGFIVQPIPVAQYWRAPIQEESLVHEVTKSLPKSLPWLGELHVLLVLRSAGQLLPNPLLRLQLDDPCGIVP